MINIIFFISVTAISFFIAWLVTCFDKWLDNKQNMLRIEEKGLMNDNWFLKYELYRDSIKEGGDINAEKTRGI